MRIQRVAILALIGSLSSCISVYTQRYLEVEHINKAFLVENKYLVVCVEGWFDHVPETSADKSKTIIIPVAESELIHLAKSSSQSEYRLDANWIRKGCPQNIPVDWVTVVIKESPGSATGYTAASSGSLYLSKERNVAFKDSIVYAAHVPDSHTVRQTRYVLQWEERRTDAVATATAPLWIPVALFVGGTVSIGEIIHAMSGRTHR